jgi:MerR family transcriptional regulator, light-induced transcriptional regulator
MRNDPSGSWETMSAEPSAVSGHRLAHSIETRLLHRLMEENGDLIAFDRLRSKKRASQTSQPESWAELALEDDLAGLAERFRQELESESDLPSLFLDILAPAARLLGQWGEEGRISFPRVDRAVRSLENLIGKFHRDPLPNATRGWRSGSILLAAFPGDLHSFGLRLVEELFRRDGWSLTTLPAPKAKDLIAQVSFNHFHVLGLSVGGTPSPDPCASLIRDLRAASLNPDLYVVVGGPAVTASNLNTGNTGADFVAESGPAAIEAMRDKLPG